MVKFCKKCKVEKSLDEFYKHNKMADGHLNVCKDCKKKETSDREKELRRSEEYVEIEKQRVREKYHRLKYKGKYKSSSVNSKNYRETYPEKYKAVIASQKILVPDGFHRHHWSYNEPSHKDIIPLSEEDHYFLHRFLDYDKESFLFRTAIKIGRFEKGFLLVSKEKHIEFFNLIKQSLL